MDVDGRLACLNIVCRRDVCWGCPRIAISFVVLLISLLLPLSDQVLFYSTEKQALKKGLRKIPVYLVHQHSPSMIRSSAFYSIHNSRSCVDPRNRTYHVYSSDIAVLRALG